jgi:hypothetical protein
MNSGPPRSLLQAEGGMATMKLEEAQRRAEAFLTGQMVAALRTVDYALPPFGAAPSKTGLAEAARAEVRLRHVRGASDCTYLVGAFGDELMLQIQLNVHRFVVVLRVPAVDALDAAGLQPRLERWRIGAEHAGWRIGWRDAVSPDDPAQRYVETYCYAFAEPGFLEDDLQQLYWRTDIVQMVRYFMLEMQRYGVALSPRAAGFAVSELSARTPPSRTRGGRG